jgi:undecaprenyl-phosphate 4-deoxy-4-formamido-L-arabinose transferase
MSAGPAIELSVVIAVYNSSATLRDLVLRLTAVLAGTGLSYEMVFVNDGSSDNSWSILSELQTHHADRIVAVNLMRNYGQHNALMCGFRRSRGRLVVTMDDDLQNPPEEIPKLLSRISMSEFDLVYGRYGGKQHESWRNLGSFLVNAFYRIVFKSKCTVTAFRIMRRELVESILSYNLNFTFIDGLLAWNTQRIGDVLVEHHPRSEGRSGYSISKLIVLALNLFTNFSLLPLQIVSALGFFVAAGGILGAGYYLLRYLFVGISVPGYASTIIAILVLGGVQLLSLGIFGEYLGRLHLNVNRKPQYVERQVIIPNHHSSPSFESRREHAPTSQTGRPVPESVDGA